MSKRRGCLDVKARGAIDFRVGPCLGATTARTLGFVA